MCLEQTIQLFYSSDIALKSDLELSHLMFSFY